MRFGRIWVLGFALALVAAAGPASAQGRGGGFGFGGPGGFGVAGLVNIPEVQKELKLEEPQIDLLKALNTEMDSKRREMFRDFQNLSAEERTKRFTSISTESEKKIGEILDAKQMARLRQLQLQREGVRGLGRKEVADQLKLTPDQRAKVQAAIDGERQAMTANQPDRQAFQNLNDEQRRELFTKLQQKFQETRTGTDAKLNAILTAPQKQQFTAMQGAPFTFPERQRRPRGNNNNQ